MKWLSRVQATYFGPDWSLYTHVASGSSGTLNTVKLAFRKTLQQKKFISTRSLNICPVKIVTYDFETKTLEQWRITNQHVPLSCPWILRLSSQNNKVIVTLLQQRRVKTGAGRPDHSTNPIHKVCSCKRIISCKPGFTALDGHISIRITHNPIFTFH